MKQEIMVDGERVVWDNDDLIAPMSPESVARHYAAGRPWILDGMRWDAPQNRHLPRPRPLDQSAPSRPTEERGPWKMTLRLPRELRDRLTRAAAYEGVSINAYVVTVLAMAIAREPRGG